MDNVATSAVRSTGNRVTHNQQTSSLHCRPSLSPSPSSSRAVDTISSSRVSEEKENTDDSEDDSHFEDLEDDEHRLRAVRQGTSSNSFTVDEERVVLRKLDRRLTLFLCLLYLLSFLDRSNIGNARVAGLQTSLQISSSQFDLTLLAFYVTYITFEWMILLYRIIPPHIYIASCVFAWGLIACLQSMVTSFSQLLILRALLGITEAAFGPGVPFYMTFFYRREELAYRVGLQISAAPLATSFASSLAWVIVKLSEYSPLEGWRALFLFEGFPSIIAAVFAYHIIPDSPAHASWLTPRERRIATLRLQPSSSTRLSPSSSSSSKLNKSDLFAPLLDPKAWLPALMFLSVNVSFASLPVFLPTIITSMSFSPLTSQLLAAPPYLLAFGFVLLTSRLSDRIPNSRALFLTASAALSATSYAVIAASGAAARHGTISESAGIVLRYSAIYPAACGLFASVVLIITWQLNNQASVSGKGVAMVMLNVVGQTGPLIGVELFPAGDGPYFVRGMAVCAGFMGFVAILALTLRVWLARLNRGSGRDVSAAKEGADGRFEMVRLGRSEGDGGEEEMEGLVSDDSDDGGDGRGRGRGRGRLDTEHDKVFRYML